MSLIDVTKSIWTPHLKAYGDGLHDDTAAIQAAIDRIKKLGGGVVHLPVGHYRVSGLTIDSAVEIRGEGWNTLLQNKFFRVEVLTNDTFKLRYGSSYVNTSALADAYTSGFTSSTADFYALKTTVDVRNLTGGNSSATDNFCASGAPNANFLALYQKLDIPLAENGYAFQFGNVRTKVLEHTAAHDGDWLKVCAGLPDADDSVSSGGSNQFGVDYYYQWLLAECCPIRSGYWGDTSYAGVWSLRLSLDRTYSYWHTSARSCLYL